MEQIPSDCLSGFADNREWGLRSKPVLKGQQKGTAGGGHQLTFNGVSGNLTLQSNSALLFTQRKTVPGNYRKSVARIINNSKRSCLHSK